MPSDAREVLNWAGSAVAVCVLGAILILGWFLLTSAIPKENENLIYAYVTGVFGLASAVVGYFFGSSHQQKKQSETIDRLSSANVPQPTQILTHPGDTVTTKTDSETTITEGRQ